MFTMEAFFNSEAVRDTIGGGGGVGQFALADNTQFDMVRSDPGLFRPYEYRGKVYVDVTTGWKPRKSKDGEVVRNKRGEAIHDPDLQPQLVSDRISKGLPVINVTNATALPKDAWLHLDRAVLESSRKRLQAYADIRAANPFGGFDAMSNPLLHWEMATLPGKASQEMEVTEAENFSRKYQPQTMPLPITFAGFELSSRFLASSRNTGQPIDVGQAEDAARIVGEYIEKQTIGLTGFDYTYGGTSTGMAYTPKVYGIINHPDRITKTDVTASATTNGETLVADVIDMIKKAKAQSYYGPYVLYMSPDYFNTTFDDFKANSDKTTFQRLQELSGIRAVRELDFLTGDVLALVDMSPDVIQAINGMEITTVQWEVSPFKRKYVVLGIQVPRVRSKFVAQTSTRKVGIVHGTTS